MSVLRSGLQTDLIRMKRMLYNTYLRWPHQTAEAFWQQDFLHPNARGHVSISIAHG